MSAEPATRHFTPAELSRFLDRLQLERPAERAEPGHREPPTSLDGARSEIAGAPQWRAPCVAPPRAQPRAKVCEHGSPASPRARVQAAPGSQKPRPPSAGTQPRMRVALAPQARPRPLVQRDSCAQDARAPRPVSLASEVAGLRRIRWWRVTFIALALLCTGLSVALCLQPSVPAVHVRSLRKPPLLPRLGVPRASTPRLEPSLDSGPASVPTVESGPAPMRTVDSGPASVPTVESGPAPMRTVESGPASMGTLESGAGPMRTHQRASRESTSRDERSSVLPSARREAVDLLLAGRTREALDMYRALLAPLARPGAHSEAASTPLEQLVQLLERELRACTAGGVSPCTR